MMQSTQRKAHCIMRVHDVKFVVTTHHNFQCTKENLQTPYHQENYGLQERKPHLLQSLKNETFEALTRRVRIFWDVKLCHWVSGS
jgi:hypothetical protein